MAASVAGSGAARDGRTDTGAIVLLDREAVMWWTRQRRSTRDGNADEAAVLCGSLKAWAALEAEGPDAGVRWLGPLGGSDWDLSLERLRDWRRELDTIPTPAPAAPAAGLAELLGGDLATPALLSLALLPAWCRQLEPWRRIVLPVGRRFRPPRFASLGDLPPLVLAAALRHRGMEVELVTELPQTAGEPTGDAHPPQRQPSAEAEAAAGAAWLAIGKLRHPEHTLLTLEAAGRPVALFESGSAPALPALFADTPRVRCIPRFIPAGARPQSPPDCPEAGALASAAQWLDLLQRWPPLVAEGQAIARERQRLDGELQGLFHRTAPGLVLVPEENSLPVERLLERARLAGCPHAVLHHTAEVGTRHGPLRWQRHLRGDEPLVVPLRDQRPTGGVRGEGRSAPPGSVLLLDAVRAHLLEALELEAGLPPSTGPAVGWIHYPLQQQSLMPLADPRAYWACLEAVREALGRQGVPLRLARKPPLEPKGLADAFAQGLTRELECLPLPQLLAGSAVVIAPGHLGTGHLEAMARGRPVVLVPPERLERPCTLLEGGGIPLPRLRAAEFADWWRGTDGAALLRLAADQREWLRRQLVTTDSLMDWLGAMGVPAANRPQRFLGSALMVSRPLLERVEGMDRLSRRVAALRRSRPGRLLDGLRRLGRP
jgi:hypothetical protein